MWVDALCIDQGNTIERGSQVLRMGDIYKLAQRVIVWLGPAAGDSDYAMSLLRDIASKIKVDWQSYTMVPSKKGKERSCLGGYSREPLQASGTTSLDVPVLPPMVRASPQQDGMLSRSSYFA
ncbi:Uu.00g097060.m01.CDS01 [Anthostomella pinea]|uniref:Uu.00g097060.m01.CDS01 n=1 Tax=Anthostomella pinea TaxID=933095 RepID=A0AAI8VCW0_9PEZI|nr:Uu.00g097060.m01.CDS01 [Anthostomella pinea]